MHDIDPLQKRVFELEVVVERLKLAEYPFVRLARALAWTAGLLVLAVIIGAFFTIQQEQISRLTVDVYELKQQLKAFQERSR